MITRLEIENFKAIKKLAIDLNPLTVLVGPNDAGKSTILQALDVLGRTVTRPIWKVGEPSVFDTDPAELLTDLRDDVEMHFAIDGTLTGSAEGAYRYEIALGYDRQRFRVRKESLRWREDLVCEADTADGRCSFREGSAVGFDGSRTAFGAYLADRREAPYRALWTELTSFLVAIEPHQLTLPCGPYTVLASSGFGLPALVDQLLTDIDRTGRDKYETDLRRFSPNVIAIGARALNDREKELVFGLPSRNAVPAREVSSGLLLAAVYVALPHLPFARFLVEEPENGVHPRALMLIADVLRNLARDGRQVIMTTHSPVLLKFFEPEDVRIITRSVREGVRATAAFDSPTFKELTQRIDFSELWYSLGDEELVASAS